MLLRADSFESPSAVSSSEDTRGLSIAIHNFRIYETHFDIWNTPENLNWVRLRIYRPDFLNIDLFGRARSRCDRRYSHFATAIALL